MLNLKEWNKVLDRYIWKDGSLTSDEYERMNTYQQEIIQMIKRSRKRSNK